MGRFAIILNNPKRIKGAVPLSGVVGISGVELFPILTRLADSYSFACLCTDVQARPLRARLPQRLSASITGTAYPVRVAGPAATHTVSIEVTANALGNQPEPSGLFGLGGDQGQLGRTGGLPPDGGSGPGPAGGPQRQ